MIFLKPRFVHFQCVKRFRFAAVDIKCQRLHFLNINNEAVFIDEGNGKRDEGVFHPHADSVAAVHDEEHSGIFRQMFAEHQTFFPVGVVGGNFDRNRDAFHHEFERIGCASILHAREKYKSSGEEGNSDIRCHDKSGKIKELRELPSFNQKRILLGGFDVVSLFAFFAFFQVECDTLALFQRLETIHFNCREMGEKIFAAVIGSDKSISLSVVKPFHGSCCHI